MKQCNNCLSFKEEDAFYTVNKRGRPVIYHICKECCSKQKLSMKDYYRDWELRKKYGISLETYKRETAFRANHCDICNNLTNTLHVDHCHTSNKIRGYLCGSCNRGIGLLKDNYETCLKAANYLKRNYD